MQISYAFYVGGRPHFTGTYARQYGLNENELIYAAYEGESPRPLSTGDASLGNAVNTDVSLGGGRILRAHDGKAFFIATVGTAAGIYTVDETGSHALVAGDPATAINCFCFAGPDLYAIALSAGALEEVYLYKNASSKAEKLTDFTSSALGLSKALPIESFQFESGNVELDGFAIKPAGYTSGQKYPAVFEIHGGPKTAYGTVFFHEMQAFAWDGYFVIFANPRGSDGRGNAFADIRGKYGTIDYDDLMRFVDVCLERYPDIDPGRIGVTGGSYGGYMTNWVIGHTDRFRAAASQKSIANWVSFAYTTDIGYFFAPDQIGASAWDSVERLWDASPLKYADKAQTPTLFIHSEEDYRCWLAEGLQMYSALRLHGVDTKLALFKGENHELSRSGKPKNRIRRLHEMLSWFNGHLKG